MRFSTLLQISAALILLAAIAPPAAAQVAPIDPQTASQGQITAFVGDRIGALAGGDPLAVRSARTALLAPLRSADADSSFRLSYSGALQQAGLDRLARDGDQLIAINAIVIAGELATPLSVNILDQALGDRREAIRYQAARSLGVLLTAYDGDRAAVPANQIDSVFTAIADRFQSERSGQVVDAMIVALGRPSINPELRTRCVTAICNGVSEVAQRWRDGAPTEAEALTVFRAVDFAFAELFGVQGGSDQDFAKAAAIASGHALEFLLSWMEDQPPASMGAETKQLANDLAAASERVLLLAHSALTGDVRNERITDLVRNFLDGRGNATLQRIDDAIGDWIGDRGLLLAAPYNAPADSFR